MLSKAILIGNVGQEPEVRENKNGKRFATFSLATSKASKNKAGEREYKTTWHKVVVFNENIVKTVENYVEKGSKLYIEGELVLRKWEDKNGETRYQTEIEVGAFSGQIVLLDRKESSGGYGAPDSAYDQD